MSEWISVQDRLPEENIRVLAAGLGVVTTDALYRGVWWCTETGMHLMASPTGNHFLNPLERMVSD